jgi:hypothetical protein
MKIELVIAWYDLWIGAYYDRKAKALFLMIPFIGLRISRKPKILMSICGCARCRDLRGEAANINSGRTD